ncbi:MAG: hypothetical protein ACI3VR_14935, partial [Intestinibacter sp.]|uniref:hypothetical protein n=1 Tax=Intestinibacter sp. TaxID=1965304 RepID=UPI003F1555BA
MKHYIVFNNLNSLYDLGLTIIEEPNIPIAKEIVEIENNKTVKTGEYNNLELTLKFRIKNPKNIYNYMDTIVDWIINYKNNDLYISAFKDRIFKVKDTTIKEPHTKFSRYGFFNVDFVLEPFKYAIEQTINVFNGQSIFYHGTVPGECNIKIYGNGNIQLTINNDTVQINNINEYVELDSKLLSCLNKDKTSKTRDMIGHFPILTRGINNISWTGSVTKVEI